MSDYCLVSGFEGRRIRSFALVVVLSALLLAPVTLGQALGAFDSSVFMSGVCSVADVEKNGLTFLSITSDDLNQNEGDVDSYTVEFAANAMTSGKAFSTYNSELEIRVNGSVIELGDIPLGLNFTETGDDTGIFVAEGIDMSILDKSLAGGLLPGSIVTFTYTDLNDATTADCDITIKKSPIFISLTPIRSVVSGTTFTVSGVLLDGISGEPIPGRTITFEAPGSTGLADATTQGFVFEDPTGLEVRSCNATQPLNPEGADGALGTSDDFYSDCVADESFDLDGINNVLHLNEGARIVPPAGTKGVIMILQDMEINAVNMTIRDSDPNTDDRMENITGMDPDAINYALVAPLGNDITEIVISQITPSGSVPTVGISRIEAIDPRGDPHTLAVVNFEDVITQPGQTDLEVGSGSFFSIGTASSNIGSWDVTAKFEGDEIYFQSNTTGTYSTIVPTWGGGGGGFTEYPETWAGFAAINCSSDTDFDSLCNSWETSGIPYQLGGTQYYLLCGNFVGEAAGTCTANGNKDILVEIDYMTGYQPLDGAINDVRAKYDAMGYKLHVVKDQQITFASEIDVWDDTDTNNNDDFYSIKQEWFGTGSEQDISGTDYNLLGNARLKAKGQAYHYGIFVRSIGNCGPSGVAETPGNDFVVALATDCVPGFDNSRNEQAGTFMHELGHNLNLDHGGPRDIKALSGVLVGSNTGNVVDGAAGDNSRSYRINSGMYVQFSSATAGEIFLTNLLTFGGGSPGTTTVTDVSFPSLGSKININQAGIQSIVSFPGATASTTRHVQLKIPFFTTGSTTATSGALGPIDVSITISTTTRTLDSMSKPGYSPNIRLDVDPNDYTMNCKANYPSVMSYSTQFPTLYEGVGQTWPLDYSNEVMDTLDENALDENAGLQSTITPRPVVYGTPFMQPNKDYGWGMTYTTAVTGIDWKGEGAIGGVQDRDLNDFDIRGCGFNDSGGNDPTPDQIQVAFNDWENLQLDFRKESSMIDGIYASPVKSAEITPEILEQIEDLVPVPDDFLLIIAMITIAIVAGVLAAVFYYTERPMWLVLAMIAIAVVAAALALYLYLT